MQMAVLRLCLCLLCLLPLYCSLEQYSSGGQRVDVLREAPVWSATAPEAPELFESRTDCRRRMNTTCHQHARPAAWHRFPSQRRIAPAPS
jgi:hypothetical protein